MWTASSEKKFVEDRKSWQTKKSNCIFVKHSLFRESNWSRKIKFYHFIQITWRRSTHWCVWETVEQNSIPQRLLQKGNIWAVRPPSDRCWAKDKWFIGFLFKHIWSRTFIFRFTPIINQTDTFSKWTRIVCIFWSPRKKQAERGLSKIFRSMWRLY